MTPDGVTLLIGSLGGFFVVIGGGARWMLTHLDAKEQASALRESQARNALSDRLNDEISLLRQDVAKLQSDKSLYMKRIYELEYFLHLLPGVNMPITAGWPPT